MQAYRKSGYSHSDKKLPGLEQYTAEQLFFINLAQVKSLSLLYRLSIWRIEGAG